MGESNVEDGVIGVYRREPIDVTAALGVARTLEDDEELAKELARVALDADDVTIDDVLALVPLIDDEVLRARTLFSVFDRTLLWVRSGLRPKTQEEVVALVEGLENEEARALALRKLPLDLPRPLQGRLASLGEALDDTCRRLEVAVHFDPSPARDRAQLLLDEAEGIVDEEERADALTIVGRVLRDEQLKAAFTAAEFITDPDVKARPLVKLAARIDDEAGRKRAQEAILDVAGSIHDPVLKFQTLAALRDLPEHLRAQTHNALFELAAGFDDPALRSGAMFDVGHFPADAALRERALVAGIAAAERVSDQRHRSRLFLLLRRSIATLPIAIRRELTRAVMRMDDQQLSEQLAHGPMGRFFVYERQGVVDRPHREPSTPKRWHLFVSHSSSDLRDAQLVARELESRAMSVFLAADDLDEEIGPKTWLATIDQQLAESRALLVIVTREALKSSQVTREWTKYHSTEVTAGTGRLLSLRLSGPPLPELPEILRRYQIIDTPFGEIEASHLARIIDIVRGPG